MLLVGLSINTAYCTGDAVIAKVPVVMHPARTQRPVVHHRASQSLAAFQVVIVMARARASGLLPF